MSTLTTTTALKEIEALAFRYSNDRSELTALATAMDNEMRAVVARYRSNLNRLAAKAEVSQKNLREAVEAHPELFVKPKTIAFAGIKVGYGKGRGTATWEDDATLIKRIRSFFPAEVAETYIRTMEEPIVDALKELDGKTLARLGVTIETTGECVIIKAVEASADKLVKRILKEGAREEGSES
ncbi:MAG TPA: host-nuclease inhibitor Gam family protein [Opitutaceae bacterium]